ncbi:uncharacterized protein LOC110241139 [Exaiptasia diaphana]|uniref:Uncharacterized protein n=1 Tax=Exaiptasia diaphana TaxID=2652724 RepID=A0A913XD70_EXADI|nr:uncharacterized protein LOC110241139 [Exaiptasia diaphana]
MAKPSKRLFAVLSLLVLLQQFSPAFTADLSHTRLRHHKKKHEKKQHFKEEGNYEDHEMDEDRVEARSFGSLAAKAATKAGTWLRKGWKFLGSKTFISKVNLVAEGASAVSSLASISITITRAIEGCTGFGNLKKNWEETEKLKKEFQDLSDTIDKLNLQALSRQIYINASFYEYRKTRDKLEEIANEKERVLLSFGPEVLVKVKNTTYEIEQLVKEKNATAQKMTEEQIYLGYKEGLELALELLFPSLTLTFSGAKLLWKKHLKNTVLGKKLVEVKTRMGNAVVSAGSSAGQSFSERIRSSKIMNTRFGRGLQKIGDGLKSGLVKAAKVFKSIGKRIAPILGLLSSAFGIWSFISQLTECQKMADKSEEGVAKMREMIADTKKVFENATIANAEIQEAFDNITNYAFNDAVTGAMGDLKTMMMDSSVAKQNDDTSEINSALQAYIDGKDINTVSDNDKLKINDVQRNANAALHRIPFTLQCYTARGKFISGVREECALGERPLSQVYDTVKRLQGAGEESSRCAEKTTTALLPTLENTKAMWKKWASSNNLEEVCLMNSKTIVKSVITQLQQGKTDATEIANAVGKSGAEDEIQVMIDILKDDPRVNQLPDNVQKLICDLRDAVNKGYMALDVALRIVNGSSPNRKVTEDDFNNQTCPPA